MRLTKFLRFFPVAYRPANPPFTRESLAGKRLRCGRKSIFVGMPKEKKLQPPQRQRRQPGREHKMKPRPKAQDEKQRGSGKLQGKVAIITGGDSGIGRAVAVAFAKEGADVAVVYLEEHKDAKETQKLVKEHGRKCLLMDGNVGEEDFCREAVEKNRA